MIRIVSPTCLKHNKHMKRTTIMLDETLLETVTKMLGAKTYSEAVNRSMDQTIRILKAQGLSEFVGTCIWEGDLSAMREDKPKKR